MMMPAIPALDNIAGIVVMSIPPPRSAYLFDTMTEKIGLRILVSFVRGHVPNLMLWIINDSIGVIY
jgi:hypothetical protein